MASVPLVVKEDNVPCFLAQEHGALMGIDSTVLSGKGKTVVGQFLVRVG